MGTVDFKNYRKVRDDKEQAIQQVVCELYSIFSDTNRQTLYDFVANVKEEFPDLSYDDVIDKCKKTIVAGTMNDYLDTGNSKYLSESISASVNDADELKELKDKLENDEEQPTEEIVDVNANIESEIKDSYVGKCVLECSRCHGLRYIDKEDLKEVEDNDNPDGKKLYNIEDECPTCHANDGWYLGGQIAEVQDEEPIDDFTEDEWEEPEEYNGPEVPSDEDDIDLDLEFDEADDESFNESINNYLRDTYLNVDKYNISGMSYDGKNFLVEGTIDYTSGLSAKSTFTLTPKKLKSNKIVLEGYNDILSSDEHSFKFLCENNDKKLVNSELRYNYSYKDQKISGKIVR